jgi:hypothetical protein
VPLAVAFLNYWTIGGADLSPTGIFRGISSISYITRKISEVAMGPVARPNKLKIKAGTGRVNTPFTQ